MHVIRTIRPGKPRSRRFQKHWGERLVAVRYRQRESTIYTTVEVIVDERQQTASNVSLISAHSQKRQKVVAIPIAWNEHTLRESVKQNGARWNRQLRAWLMRYDTAVVLGIQDRIAEGLAERCTDVDTSFQLGPFSK